MANAITVEHGDWKTYQHECERVRLMVFVAEQKVPRELEMDEHDAEAEHFVAFDGRRMVEGCARMLPDGHIGRVAVLRPFRGRGVGTAVMQAVIARAKEKGLASVYLGAQVHAVPFYEKLGFAVEGEPFTEAGIPHRRMRLTF